MKLGIAESFDAQSKIGVVILAADNPDHLYRLRNPCENAFG
jgi:hypothetical protein